MIRRRSIRRNLTEFARLCGYEPAAHHKLLIDALAKVAKGEISNLAVFMPPGSAKSTYASVLFPAWVLAQERQNILAASHKFELAQQWGRRVRNLLVEYSLTLGVELSFDNTAAGRWALKDGTEYYAAGTNTGIAGFRGKLGIIDDPVGSRQQADSETARNHAWEWYLNDFIPRLIPGSRKVLIQTRWHEDDLAGRALQHEDWHVISLPAIAEANDPLGRTVGTPLWSDDSYGYGQQLLDLRSNTPARTWSALYQQRPAPDEGDFFKAEWFVLHATPPARELLKIYGASDYAVTSDGGDYTVHVIVGIDQEGKPWLLDLWREQTDTARWIEKLCDLIIKWRPMEWGEESGQINSAVGPFIEKQCRERGASTFRRQFGTRGDKSVRAQGIRGLMSMRGLHIPQGAPWFEQLRSECLSFPAGKHDDQVDALGLIGQMLDTATNVYNLAPKLRINQFARRNAQGWMGG